MSEVRNQLQTLTGAAIEAAQLSQVGGKVFTNSQDAQVDFQALTSFWRAIHVPTYGQAIPGSAFTVNHTGDGAAYAPGVNESALINGLTISNADPANPATVSLDLDGVIVYQSAPIASFQFETVIGLQDNAFQITNGQTLSVTVAGAAPASVSVDFAGFLVVQG